MPPVLGIDLGTTNTAAAWISEEGQLEIVDVSDASRALPSVVSLLDTGVALVGEQAKEMLGERPKTTFYGLKRLLGRRFASDYIARHRHRFTFDIVEGEHGDVCLSLDGHPVALDDILAFVVERIVELANACAGLKFEECVVSVPAHFTFRQRLKTAQIVERVLKVKALVNEPTAAALVFALEDTRDRNVLVYDLGGGTFDVTVLKVADGDVRVLASGGDAFLGGIDFDRTLADSLVKRFVAAHGVDPTANGVAAHRIVLAAEGAKIRLSETEQTQVRVPGVFLDESRFLDLDLSLTRAELQTICAPLVERTIGIVEETLKSVGSPKIEEVVLVGGQTADPAVRQRLYQVLGVVPRRTKQADLAVAVGAALHATGRCALSDVTSVPVFMAVPGGPPRELVEAHTRLPCRNVIEVDERPPLGQDLNLLLYEAVSLSATERDIIGSCTVPAAWLADVNKAFELEVMLSSGHGLTLVATAPGVKSQHLPLVDITLPRREAIKAEAPIDLSPDDQVFDVDEPVGFRTNQVVPFTTVRMVGLSASGATLAVEIAPTVASTIELQIPADEGPIKLRGVVGMSRPDPKLGETLLSLEVRFSSDQPEELAKLAQRVAAFADRLSVSDLPSDLDGEPILDDSDLEIIEIELPEDEPLVEAPTPRPFMAMPTVTGTPTLTADELFSPDVWGDSGPVRPSRPPPLPLDEGSAPIGAPPGPAPSPPRRRRVAGKVEMLKAVSTFIQAVRQDALYDALALEPEAPIAEVNAQIELLRSVVKNLSETVGSDLAGRLEVALRFLDRIRGILTDPQRRLAYDFKHGHVHADERLARATGDGEQLALLRRCWMTTFPHRAVEAQRVNAVLQRALAKEDSELALDAGEMVLKLDPFNLQLRETLATLRIQALHGTDGSAPPVM